MEEGIERQTLQAVDEHGNKCEEEIDSQGYVDQFAECFGCETKVEEKEGRFDDEVHEGVHDFLCEKTLIDC